MSFILRGISKAKWNRDQSDFAWLQPNELVADVFNDIRTKNGELSIYTIDEDQTNLNRIIGALACSRPSLQNFDYVLVPKVRLEQDFDTVMTEGETADAIVNSWHLDIVHLTPEKLTALAYLFRNENEALTRLPWKDVETQIRSGLEQGYIDINHIKFNSSLRKKFQP